jgi:hypothetical protein
LTAAAGCHELFGVKAPQQVMHPHLLLLLLLLAVLLLTAA